MTFTVDWAFYIRKLNIDHKGDNDLLYWRVFGLACACVTGVILALRTLQDVMDVQQITYPSAAFCPRCRFD